MSYRGTIIPVPMGSQGLVTDSAANAPPQSLLEATNVSLRYGIIEKCPGSRRWNNTVFPGEVAGFHDFWVDDVTQRIIVGCRDGKLYKMSDAYTRSELTASGSAPSSLTWGKVPRFIAGGSESAGASRKLFVFTGNDPIQVLSGDGSTRSNITSPAADWTTNNYPQSGLIYNGKFWAFGNKNHPHNLYVSSATDHEDFSTIGASTRIAVYPGDGDKIVDAFVYKKRLFVLKFPGGLYWIDDSGATPVPYKLTDSFGALTPAGRLLVLDDVLVANSTGSITSLKASDALGETEQGDFLKMLGVLKSISELSNPAQSFDRHALYYEDKKQALFTYRSATGFRADRILVIDFHTGDPKVAWYDKDLPLCLGLIRDHRRIPRPFYGAADGYIYDMDAADRNVAGAAYTGRFQTQWIDFGFADPKLKDLDKHFDFLGLTFEPTGNWDLSGDIFIDGRYVQTVTWKLTNGTHLGAFTLGTSRLSGPNPITRVVPLSGSGKRISVRLYNATAGQNFKVSGLVFYFRPGGQNNR